MAREPVANFGPWTPWLERNTVRNAHLPGVYLLALWDAPGPPPSVDPSSEAIIYIGETTEGSLLGRWQQFNRAAFSRKPGHTGGMVYSEIVGDEGERLYVSAFAPEGLARELRTLYIRYLAARTLWEWARKWENAPLCNSRG